MDIVELEVEHRQGDQVFSYWYEKKLLHFNVTLIERVRELLPRGVFTRITMDMTEQMYRLCMEHRGIEEQKIERLRPVDLRQPGLACILPNDNFTMVDGHHRFVRRYRAGVRVMDMWVCPVQVWAQCLAPYPEEVSNMLAEHVPQRVDNPEAFATTFTRRDG